MHCVSGQLSPYMKSMDCVFQVVQDRATASVSCISCSAHLWPPLTFLFFPWFCLLQNALTLEWLSAACFTRSFASGILLNILWEISPPQTIYPWKDGLTIMKAAEREAFFVNRSQEQRPADGRRHFPQRPSSCYPYHTEVPSPSCSLVK